MSLSTYVCLSVYVEGGQLCWTIACSVSLPYFFVYLCNCVLLANKVIYLLVYFI